MYKQANISPKKEIFVAHFEELAKNFRKVFLLKSGNVMQ